MATSQLDAKQRWKLRNKANIAAWNRQYYLEHKDDYYKRHISYRYDLTVADFVALLKKYKGKCPICLRKVKYKLCIDHDHNTGKVRGLLCKGCNVKLDWADKYEKRIRKYLGKT